MRISKKPKKIYVEFETRHTKYYDTKYRSASFCIMRIYKKELADDMDVLAGIHEKKLLQLEDSTRGGRDKMWLVQKQATLLANHYNSLKRKTDVERVLRIWENVLENEMYNISRLEIIILDSLYDLCELYRCCGIRERVEKVYVKIQELSPLVFATMQPYFMETTVPKEYSDTAANLFGENASSDAQRWENFVNQFVQGFTDMDKKFKEQTQFEPLLGLAETRLIDNQGLPSSYVKSCLSDSGRNVRMYMAENLLRENPILETAIAHLLKSGTLTVDKIMDNLIIPSPIFKEERYCIIRESLDFYIREKYVLFCHLIVPQIECAVRNLVTMREESIMEMKNDEKSFQMISLDMLLRKDCVKDCLTYDGATYLQTVLTNDLWLNIRNNLCHGLVPPEYFGKTTACRLFHVLAILGLQSIQ